MIAHGLSILVLLGYAFEVYRTVNRFGQKRRGMTGSMLGRPSTHGIGAVILGGMFLGFFLNGVGPRYLGGGGMLISLVYLGFIVHWALTDQSDEEE